MRSPSTITIAFVKTLPLPSQSFPNRTAFTGLAGALSCATVLTPGNRRAATPNKKHAVNTTRTFIRASRLRLSAATTQRNSRFLGHKSPSECQLFGLEVLDEQGTPFNA